MKLPYRKKLQTFATSALFILASCCAAPGLALAHGGGHHHGGGGRHWHHGANGVGIGIAIGAAAITMAAVASSRTVIVRHRHCVWSSNKVCHFNRWGDLRCHHGRRYRRCYN